MRIPTIMNVKTMLSGKQFMYCLRMVVSLSRIVQGDWPYPISWVRLASYALHCRHR